MAIFSNSNLPTAAQKWGREVESRINSVESRLSSSIIDNAARDTALGASIQSATYALGRLKTSSTSGHKRYFFNGGAIPTQPPVIEFAKPAWATKAVILATTSVDARATYSGGSGNPVYGTAKMFINGEICTYEAYDWNSNPPLQYITQNMKELLVEAPAGLDATGSVLINHSGTVDVSAVSTLSVWGSFNQIIAPDIPPINYNEWDTETFNNWSVGLNASNSCSVEVSATVFWIA